MANINDYIKWRGDIALNKEYPFNEIDSMILARFSYLIFNQIHMQDKELYVSYIGTDASIYGWKEDFNMAFMKNVPCQIEGKRYLEKIANKYKTQKIRVGGHSIQQQQ